MVFSANRPPHTSGYSLSELSLADRFYPFKLIHEVRISYPILTNVLDAHCKIPREIAHTCTLCNWQFFTKGPTE